MALTPSGPASNAGANMSPAAPVAAKPMPSGSASPARTAGPGPSSAAPNMTVGSPTNMSSKPSQPSPVIVSTSKPADQHIQTLGQNINNHINSINTQAANKPPINPASISTPPINIQKNAQGLTPQQMSQQATNQMQQRVIGAAQAAPGTLQTGAQMGSLQTGTGQTPVTFQAQTTTPETTRNAQIAEVARLNGISPEEAATRVDNASKNGGAGLPPGVAYDRTTGQAFDVKTGAIYQGSTGPDFQGMRFQDSGTYTNPQTGETTSTGMGGGGMGGGAGTTQSTQDQLASLNSQSDKAYLDYTTKISSIQNGTFPLNPNQQATINSIMNNFNQLKTAQQSANENYVNAIGQAGITSGRSRYAPEIQAQELQQAVSTGIAKIAQIEGDASKALTEAQTAFQKEDYTEATNSYDILQKHLDAKSSQLATMQKNIQDHLDKVNQFNIDQQKQNLAQAKEDQLQKHQDAMEQLTEQHQNAMEKLQSEQNSLADKRESYNEVMQNRNFSEQQKRDAQTAYNEAQTRSIESARLSLERSKEAFTETQGADPLGISSAHPDTIKGLMDSGVISKNANGGEAYLDLTNFTDPKSKAEATKVARQAGIPILDAKETQGLTSINDASNTLQRLSDMFQKIAPQDPSQKLTQGAYNFWGQLTDSDQGALIKQYNSLSQTLLPGIVKSLTGLNRINTTELDKASSALPALSATSSDTWKDAQLKIQGLVDTLNDQKKNLLGGQVKYTSLDDWQNHNNTPEQTKYLADLHEKYPDWSPDDALQFIQYGSSGGGGFNGVDGDTNQAGDVNKIAEAIGKFESGGRYNAIGPVIPSGAYAGDHAIGKYQIMGRNVPSWTKQALGYSMTPQEFLRDQDAQDKTARHFMQQHLDRYGRPEDVASMWLSGRPMVNNQATDLATGISVPQYIKNVMKNYNS